MPRENTPTRPHVDTRKHTLMPTNTLANTHTHPLQNIDTRILASTHKPTLTQTSLTYILSQVHTLPTNTCTNVRTKPDEYKYMYILERYISNYIVSPHNN